MDYETIRKTFADRFVETGIDPDLVKAVMGKVGKTLAGIEEHMNRLEVNRKAVGDIDFTDKIKAAVFVQSALDFNDTLYRGIIEALIIQNIGLCFENAFLMADRLKKKTA